MKEPTRTPTLEEFLACCAREFDYVVREHGFVLLTEPREYNQFSACFRKGELGVEVYGENWGANASCDLRRGKDLLPLSMMIPELPRGEQPPRRVTRDQLAQVRANAEWLRLHASDFLQGDLRRFESALAEWKRMTRPRPVSEATRKAVEAERARQQALTAAGHASKRASHAEVVRLLEPYAAVLSPRQKRMLDAARAALETGSR